MKSFKTRETTTNQTMKSGIYAMPERAERSGHNDQQESALGKRNPTVILSDLWSGRMSKGEVFLFHWHENWAGSREKQGSRCDLFLAMENTLEIRQQIIRQTCAYLQPANQHFFFRVCSRTPALQREQFCDPHLELQKAEEERQDDVGALRRQQPK